ncbi:MAG: hypothetical protein MSS71_07370, partial [Campylobacter sp.]|uniref:hypothetical protein n=1 Tax=Campylobacter sp. TaxID=205 RepID=UPI002AA86D45
FFAKTFALFFCGLRLKNSVQNFCSCRRRSPTASAAALKLKIAHPAGAKQPADAKQKNLGA